MKRSAHGKATGVKLPGRAGPAALLLILILASSGGGAKAAEHPFPPPLFAADIMNAFSAGDPAGASWCAERLKDRVTIIHFWATWCPPCRKEIEHLRKEYGDHGGRDLTIIGINLEAIDRVQLNRFLASQRVDWPQINEPDAFRGRLARLFRVTQLPAAFLVDRRGVIRPLHAHDRGAIGSAIEAALKEPAR